MPRFQNRLPRAHPRCPLCTPPGVGNHSLGAKEEEREAGGGLAHSLSPSILHSFRPPGDEPGAVCWDTGRSEPPIRGRGRPGDRGPPSGGEPGWMYSTTGPSQPPAGCL